MIAFFDCFSGISGDMILGALVDAGVPLRRLERGLSQLAVKGYELKARKTKRAGISSTKVDVVKSGSKQKARNWKDIEKVIKDSTLPASIKKRGRSIFKRLFEAEARVHGGRYDTIHLHELGAVDCIVDIFGTLIGLDVLGIENIYSSPLNLGSGTIETEHGTMPVPAPATVELLKGTPVYSSDIKFELTTPTGAVLITSLASEFGPLPDMNISGTGIGAGGINLRGRPNVLRLFIGEELKQKKADNEIAVIETNIDDMNPEVYEYVMDKLFKAGALDVFLTQVIMKKGRPAVKLTVLSEGNRRDMMIGIILKETTSIGLRFYSAERKVLQREIKSIKTKYGTIRVKESRLGDEIVKVSPEYEDCKKIARKYDIPLVEVLRLTRG
jgi:uncharacterized protein (TIGR00299 family) protein